MALIQCKDCGRDISDRAMACIHCGAPIATTKQFQQLTPATEKSGNQNDRPASKRRLYMLVGVMVVLFVMLILSRGGLSGYGDRERTINTIYGAVICNRSSVIQQLALGMEGSNGFLQSWGWEKLFPGQCETLVRTNAPARVFAYARSHKPTTNDTQEWKGTNSFCISEDEDFRIIDQRHCDKSAGFVEVSLGPGENPGTRVFRESDDRFKDSKSAETAGLQRMLNLSGYNAGPVDGSLGQTTTHALLQFRKEQGLQIASSKQIFNRLEETTERALRLPNKNRLSVITSRKSTAPNSNHQTRSEPPDEVFIACHLLAKSESGFNPGQPGAGGDQGLYETQVDQCLGGRGYAEPFGTRE